MSSPFWRTAAAVLCLLPGANRAAADLCIEVDLRFAGRVPGPEVVEALQIETSEIWRPYNVRIEWPSTQPGGGCSRALGTFDVVVEHQPAATDNLRWHTVLGSTRLVPAAIEHAGIHIDFGETERLVTALPSSTLIPILGYPHVRAADIGRALGRVLGHEVGHVLLADPLHSRDGLMRKWLPSTELVTRQRRDFTLSKQEIERLREREIELIRLSASGREFSPGPPG